MRPIDGDGREKEKGRGEGKRMSVRKEEKNGRGREGWSRTKGFEREYVYRTDLSVFVKTVSGVAPVTLHASPGAGVAPIVVPWEWPT